MKLPRQAVLDKVKMELFSTILEKQQENNLTVFDIESILYQLLVDVKSDKEGQYANIILSMAEHINNLEKDKKNEGDV